jgi:hypothetical protein
VGYFFIWNPRAFNSLHFYLLNLLPDPTECVKEMSRIGLTVTCVWALIGLVSVNGELYTASNDLVSTFHLEQQVVNVLGELVSKAEAKINAIRKYLKDYESIVEEKTSSEDEFMERVAGKLSTLSPFVNLFTRHV